MRERLELDTDEAIVGPVPLTSVLSLAEAGESTDVFRWAVETLEERIDADLTQVAITSEDLLVPITSSRAGETGREHAIPLATSIPGSVVASDEGCVIDDRHDVRGVATVPTTPSESDTGFRSLVCAPISGHGAIIAFGRTPEQFTEEDLEVVTSVSCIVENMVGMIDGEQGHHADPLLEEIGNMVSHDLRNKINIATGRLDLAIKTDDEDHLVRSVEALESVERIADVVVSLARTGQPLNELEGVQLGDAVEEAFGPLGGPHSTLTIKASARILADPDCLSQLLENLFRNAIEHSDGEVNIEVGLLEDGFYVSDNGPGIPADVREDVCELGYTTASGHQGKGLTIVSRMAEAHGWTVDITESTNGGARIEIGDVVFR